MPLKQIITGSLAIFASFSIIEESYAQTASYDYGNNSSLPYQSAIFDVAGASTYSINYVSGGVPLTTGPFISSGYLDYLWTGGQNLLYSNLGGNKSAVFWNDAPLPNPTIFLQYQLYSVLLTSPPQVNLSSVVNGYVKSGYLLYEAHLIMTAAVVQFI